MTHTPLPLMKGSYELHSRPCLSIVGNKLLLLR
jgi:hypothetical protein